MKKIILALFIVAAFFVVIGGGVFFDYYRQNQKMNGIQAELDNVDTLANNEDTKTAAETMLDSARFDLIRISDRWIAGRKLLAQERINQLQIRLRKRNKPMTGPDYMNMSNEDLQKEMQKLSNSVKKN